MNSIGPKAIEEAGKMTKKLLSDYRKEIEKAYLSTDDALSIGLKLEIKPAQHGGLDLQMTINFVTERVKDKTTCTVDERQLSLFETNDRRLILFRQFNWPRPAQHLFDARPYKKGTPSVWGTFAAPPFFTRATRRLRALLFKKFD